MTFFIYIYFLFFRIGALPSSSVSYLGEFHNNKNRSIYVSFAVTGMSIAVIYQSIVGLTILPMEWKYHLFGPFYYTPWRLYLLLSSFIMAIAFSVVLCLPESPKFLLSQGKHSEAMKVLQRIYVTNTGKPKEVSLYIGI